MPCTPPSSHFITISTPSSCAFSQTGRLCSIRGGPTRSVGSLASKTYSSSDGCYSTRPCLGHAVRGNGARPQICIRPAAAT